MLTNRHNLPAPLVRAIQNDPYDAGASQISVTRLIQPPQLVRLSRGHEATEDASERIWALLGQAVHTVLERANTDPSVVVEKRLFAEVLGWKVSGQLDVYDRGRLSDYKITSVYAYGRVKPEWENQLNLLAALARLNELPVTALEIVAIFRDWRPKEALSDDYPDSQVAVVPVKLWPPERAQSYLEERVQLHQAETPIPCTDEERWMQPEKWALMAKGKKRAIKLFDAKPGHLTLTEGQYWEHRPGAYRRCESYCSVSEICPQWAKDRKEVEEVTA